jgi:opacity protein-like surface antigen
MLEESCRSQISNTAFPTTIVAGRACWLKRLTKSAAAGFSLSVLAALALQSAPAVAEEQARTQSVEIFGGEQFGDNLTDGPVSRRTPRLNDDAVAGARYNYNFTDMWGIQLSSGYSWSRASRVASGRNDLRLTTVDLDAVWNITPQYPIVAYAIIGAGYTWANLNAPSRGSSTAGLSLSPTATASRPMPASVPSTIWSTISMLICKLAIATSIDSSATQINT